MRDLNQINITTENGKSGTMLDKCVKSIIKILQGVPGKFHGNKNLIEGTRIDFQIILNSLFIIVFIRTFSYA